MKELYKYQQQLKNMNLEQLLKELEKQIEDSQYHKFVSKNENLMSECKDKLMLIKLQIIDNYKTIHLPKKDKESKMIKIIPKSKQLIIGDEYLDTIRFGLEDILEIYKKEFLKYNNMDYYTMSGEEIYIMNCYENKIYDIENLLKQINEAIEKIN